MMIVLPIVQLLLFGYAINTDVRHIPSVLYDQDHSAQSRDLARSLEATGFYDFVGDVGGYEDIQRALRANRARVALVIPAGYASNLARGKPARGQLVVDGSDPQTVASATNTAASLVAARSSRILLQRLRTTSAGFDTQPIELEASTWY